MPGRARHGTKRKRRPKPPLSICGKCLEFCLAALGCTLGCLQGVDLGSGSDFELHMGGKVAATAAPLGSGVGVAGTEGLALKFAQAITALALVNGRRQGETVHDDAFGRPGSILQSLHMSLPALGAVRIFLSFVCQASANDGKKGARHGGKLEWHCKSHPLPCQVHFFAIFANPVFGQAFSFPSSLSSKPCGSSFLAGRPAL